jgi:WD40 repeat protein
VASPRVSQPPTVVAPAVDPVVTLPAAVVLRDHEGEVVACDWLGGVHEALVSGCKDSVVRLWDVNTQQCSKIPVQFPQGDSSPHLTNVVTHPSQPLALG